MLMIKQAFLILSFLQHAVFSKEGTVISLLLKETEVGNTSHFQAFIKRKKYIFCSSGQEQAVEKLQM